MANEGKLVAESRQESGHGTGRRLRKLGWLPGIINNDKGEARMIRVNLHDFEQRLRHHTGENLILDVSVDGEPARKVLLREVQHDGLTGGVLHADFVEISMTRKMRVRITILLRGDPIGVLQEGGILEQLLREVEVECLPADLIESVELDVSDVHVGKRLLVSDLKMDPKLTVLTAPDVAVAAVLLPKEEETPEEAAVAEGEVAGAEPEVIAKGKEDEEGEEGADGKPAAKAGAPAGAAGKAGAAKGDAKAGAAKAGAPAAAGKAGAPAAGGKAGAAGGKGAAPAAPAAGKAGAPAKGKEKK